MIAPPAKIYARDRSRSRWNMKHFRQTANRTRLLAAPVLAVDLLACTRRRHCSLTRDSHQPVMTGHNARRPRTGRERRPWWPPSEASYLTVWTLNDRFFASRVHCILWRVLSEYWRKETEKSKVFCGVVGLDGRCSAQAEQRKKPVAVVHLPGAYLSTETNLVPIRGVMREEFDTGQTDRQTHTHTEWKSLRLDLLEVDRMTALIHYERQRWKKVNFFAKKPLPRFFFQHVQTLCMPSFIDLHTHATPGHVTSFVCSRNTSDRSLAWSRHRRRSTRAIDRDRGETWNTSGKPQTARGCLLHQYCQYYWQ